VRAVTSQAGVKSGEETMVASADASEVYVFNRLKQHVRTVSGLTGVLRWALEYDSAGRLLSATDGEGRKTTVERDSTGQPLAIVGPYGHRNTLTSDSVGYLKTVTNPLGETVSLTHTAGGLLTQMVDARGGVHAFAYEADGRLRRDTNALGGFKELTRMSLQGAGYKVEVTTSDGRKTTYESTPDTGAGEAKRVTASDGTVSTRVHFKDGSYSSTAANGMKTSVTTGGDARYGTMSPTAATRRVTTPSGLSWQGAETTAVSWANGSEAYGLESLTKTSNVNGRQWKSVYTAADRTWTWTTPMGRTGRVVLDEKERPVRSEAPGVEAAAFSYDATGRLESITQGARKVEWAYDGQGSLSVMTDAAGRETRYAYSGALRPTEVRLPGVGLLGLETDASGNVTRVTSPGGRRHGYGYDLADQETSYGAPELAGVKAQTYQYSPGLLLTSGTHPDGTQSVLRRDEAGRVVGVSAPWGETAYWRTVGTGQLTTVTRNGQQLEYRYDGALLTSEAASGVVSGVVSRVFDSFFRITSLAVNGAAVAYGYDEDGLLVSAGPVVLTRSAATGQVMSTQVGKTRTTYGYDAYGALTSLETSVASVPIFREDVTFDMGGNVAGKSVTVKGVGSRSEYSYDEALRLTTEKRDGAASGSWTYDAEGNRLTSDGTTASFDARGRLLAQGATTYGYDAFGNRTRKVAGEGTTEYRYAGAGALTGVTLPDGALVEYVIDARGRRVAKKKDGVFHAGWLYDGQLRIVGEVNSTGTLTSRFVYGTVGHSPDVMVRGGVTYRYVHDSLGSVRLVVNAETGEVVQRLDYDSWGVVTADTSPGLQPFGYAGGLYDSDTKLVRFGARDYDATTGAWLSPEPLSQSPAYVTTMASRGMQVPAYAYALNNPLFWVDPTGLWAAGISLDIDLIVPFLSGGGGSFGFNVAYTSSTGFGVYYYGPTSDPSRGFSVGASVQVCGGPGEGDWTGEFETTGGSYGPLGGGYYESVTNSPSDPAGYAGFYGAFGPGAPGGLFQSRTNYVQLW
jgi:RHS repeat-associated protein